MRLQRAVSQARPSGRSRADVLYPQARSGDALFIFFFFWSICKPCGRWLNLDTRDYGLGRTSPSWTPPAPPQNESGSYHESGRSSTLTLLPTFERMKAFSIFTNSKAATYPNGSHCKSSRTTEQQINLHRDQPKL
jgi:hypothetical protein